MPAVVFSAGKADVSNHADEPSPRNEGSKGEFPHFVELKEKILVILNVSKLTLAAAIFFECPVWRGSEDQVDAFRFQMGKIAGIEKVESMSRWNLLKGSFNFSSEFLVFSDCGKGGLWARP